jgi:adenosylcobinamide-GDP ribazoletransferase
MTALPYVRMDASSKALPLTRPISWFSLLVCVTVCGLVIVPMGWMSLKGMLGVLLSWLYWRWLFKKRLGGYTGDCLGALQQTSESMFYLGMACVL